jgi:hypothetical protein
MVNKHCDTDKFIELMRVRPVIWDIKSDDYANRNLRKEAWNELLRLMINDFDVFAVAGHCVSSHRVSCLKAALCY